MRPGFALAALTAALLSSAALAQMGPGMMHGPGPGAGPGPGMVGGQGLGPCGQGGAGMMQGPGMGRGMMGGHGMGGGMMGGGMMGGFPPGALEALNLTEEQRGKLTQARRDLQRKRHALMGSMHELQWQQEDAAKSGEIDVAAARKTYDAMAAIRKQMFEAGLEARKSIEAALTKEQREQLRKAAPRGGYGPG